MRSVALRRGGRGRSAGGRGAEAEDDRWRLGQQHRRRRGGRRGRARERVVTARGAQSARLALQRVLRARRWNPRVAVGHALVEAIRERRQSGREREQLGKHAHRAHVLHEELECALIDGHVLRCVRCRIQRHITAIDWRRGLFDTGIGAFILLEL